MELPPIRQRVAAEALGTFGFFFLGFSGVAAATDLPGSIGAGGVAAGFGLGLALMIAAFGHVSGGHFNPAVTAGLATAGRFPAADVVAYWIAQLVGGVVAALAAWAIYSDEVRSAIVSSPGEGIGDGTAIVIEFVATFLFLLVILTVATDARAPWNGVLAPVAIGGFIFTAATVLGPFSGGSFNPARSLAPAIVDGSFSTIWIYLIGPLAGGVLAGLVHPLVTGGRTADA